MVTHRPTDLLKKQKSKTPCAKETVMRMLFYGGLAQPCLKKVEKFFWKKEVSCSVGYGKQILQVYYSIFVEVNKSR